MAVAPLFRMRRPSGLGSFSSDATNPSSAVYAALIKAQTLPGVQWFNTDANGNVTAVNGVPASSGFMNQALAGQIEALIQAALQQENLPAPPPPPAPPPATYLQNGETITGANADAITQAVAAQIAATNPVVVPLPTGSPTAPVQAMAAPVQAAVDTAVAAQQASDAAAAAAQQAAQQTAAQSSTPSANQPGTAPDEPALSSSSGSTDTDTPIIMTTEPTLSTDAGSGSVASAETGTSLTPWLLGGAAIFGAYLLSRKR